MESERKYEEFIFRHMEWDVLQAFGNSSIAFSWTARYEVIVWDSSEFGNMTAVIKRNLRRENIGSRMEIWDILLSMVWKSL